eukprot:6979489-Pyramimonas_sp.AAC.1
MLHRGNVKTTIAAPPCQGRERGGDIRTTRGVRYSKQALWVSSPPGRSENDLSGPRANLTVAQDASQCPPRRPPDRQRRPQHGPAWP